MRSGAGERPLSPAVHLGGLEDIRICSKIMSKLWAQACYRGEKERVQSGDNDQLRTRQLTESDMLSSLSAQRRGHKETARCMDCPN